MNINANNLIDIDKGYNILLYIAYNCNLKNGEINYIKLMNIFFLAYKLYLKQYWIALIHDDFYADKDWLIAKGLSKSIVEENNYFTFNKKTKDLTPLKKVNQDYLSETEIRLLNAILKTFKKESVLSLLKIVKNLNEWKNYKRSNEKIDILAIFWTSINEPKIFKTPKDIINSSIFHYMECSIYHNTI